MKIIITAPSLDPSINVSGVSSVTSFIIDNNKNNKYIHIELGKRDNERRSIKWFIRILSSFWSFSYLSLTKRIDIIHFNYALSKPSIIRDTPFIFFARLIKCKMVMHFHGGEFLMHESPPKWINVCLKYIFSGNEVKIVLSDLEKEIIENKFKGNNLKVLSNCVDLQEAEELTKQTNHTKVIKILFLGRITLSKGIETIIEAIKIIKAKEIPIIFICAGKGPEEVYFIEQMSKILGSSFEYRGVLKGRDKVNVFKETDIFLLPSLFGEGLPMALLEAMSFGLVPIVTNDGSMKFVVANEMNGFIIGKGNYNELVRKIIELNQKRDKLLTLGNSAKKYIFQNFNPEDYIKKLNEFYE
ncbi:glycosyltransferase family 4 protein [Emticicia sp. BO119]|uniref:glycosyltransferase family 4 protein n=1 Tax=Emticicia sp. BO119 TaxID=2757768 RepID=UPI0015F0F2BF|nr:glycosyltransferase family 4 protein [Emticicia sp. BO119]MBA4850529.1 glycosyltransferase family 4 protein [Emticicia sp. BO119]